MAISSESFVKEIQEMVRKKHSKDHPVIGMIESGELSREGLKGFVGQFYLFFPKPFLIVQKRLLKQLSQRMNQSRAELVRKAVHYFLRDNGLDDGLICDKEEMLESLPEIPKL